MAGNSARRGSIKKTGKGNPTAGSGGRVKRGLEGRGPTPKAKDREGHIAYKSRKAAEKAAAPRRKSVERRPATPSGSPGATPSWRRCASNMPVSAVYVAEGAERDGRMRETFRIVADRGISLLEIGRVELDRLTDGAVESPRRRASASPDSTSRLQSFPNAGTAIGLKTDYIRASRRAGET